MPQAGLEEREGRTGRRLGVGPGLCLLAAGAALVLCFFRGGLRAQPGPGSTPLPTGEADSAPSPDTEPPVIRGPRDMSTAVGMTLSYRSGVTAVDETDGPVGLEVDASAVNLGKPGEYPVVYRARDRSGNVAEIAVTLTVAAVTGVKDDDPTADVSGEGGEAGELLPIREVTAEMVEEEAGRILDKILTPSMSLREQARAIYNYVHTHVKYVGSSDKSSWLVGAYVGFTRGRGDCYNYFACSKALLTKAGIPNVDLSRVGGGTDHYWQLVNVGSGWYHFDACPHPDSYPLYSFLLDEMAVRAYTEKCAPVRSNYYVYDYAGCPVRAAGFPPEEPPAESGVPAGEEPPAEGETLLPPCVLEAEKPGEVQAPESLTEPEGAGTPRTVETQTPEEAAPSPAPGTDPLQPEKAAEAEASGKEETQ